MTRKIAAILIFFYIITMLSSTSAKADVGVKTEPDLQGRVIILDAGHGRGGSPAYAGYVEHEAMLKLAFKIKPLLEARGATVLMTRTNDYNVHLSVRAALINKWALEAVRDARHRELSLATTEDDGVKLQSDINEINRLLTVIQNVIDDPAKNASIYLNVPFDMTYTRRIHPDWQKIFEYQDDPEIRNRFLTISLHSNATTRPVRTSVNGAIIYYVSNDIRRNASYYTNYSHTGNSRYFAEQLLNNIDPLGIRGREASEHYWFMIREHNTPGVLAENGYHTNSRDRAKLSDDAFLDRLALVYDETITDYFVSYVGALPEVENYRDCGENITDEECESTPSDPLASASEWARDGIQSALAKGFVPVDLRSNYKDVITRAEFCQMAISYLEHATGKDIETVMLEMGVAPEPNVFTDTDAPYILAAHALGVTNGTGNNMFTPDGFFSREQAAAMILNVCRVLGKSVENAPSCRLEDMDDASAWAIEGINYCVANGLMSGTGNNSFSPKQVFTREQSILVFNNIPLPITSID